LVRDEELLGLLRDAALAVRDAIGGLRGQGLSGGRPTQYHADVVADAAAVAVLVSGGLRVLSEESDVSGSGPVVCVLDPIDGSTNFDRGIPYYSTSLCALDDEGARCSVVVNHATDTWYEAVRGAGATRDGAAIHPSAVTQLRAAIVSFSGLPSARGGWAQFRALGSASLELCAVADGSLDGYAVVASSRLSPWDYLGGIQVLCEAGAPVSERAGAPLVVADRSRRRPVAAGTAALLDELHGFVAALDGGGTS
jgi:fructose-1,6-bisphosphatase/inositol monophosphatase family enzyme